MHRFSDCVKMDIGLVSQALNNTNVTGRYFDMAMWGNAVAILNIGAMAAGKTATMELLQAQDASGTGAKAIPPAPATELATAQITANTNVSAATLTLATVLVGDSVTINGLTFTAAAAADLPNRVFSQAGDDTADAASLTAAINDSTGGVPGITATSALGAVTLTASDSGDTLITITNPAATITAATTKAIAFIDLDVSQLDINNGFSFIAVKVATTANSNVAATLLRTQGRFIPINQKAGASSVV